MSFIYYFFTSFLLIFVSELGDKTQILVLTLSSKLKYHTILLGVALGSLLSHGLAITLGSTLGNFQNLLFQNLLKIISYLAFISIGIISFFPSKKEHSDYSYNLKYKFNYVLFIAFTILIGEIGDKTFLSSIGLGIQYPAQKLPLVFGAVAGMLGSNILAILAGKYIAKKVSPGFFKILSGTLFLIFGIFGILQFFSKI